MKIEDEVVVELRTKIDGYFVLGTIMTQLIGEEIKTENGLMQV